MTTRPSLPSLLHTIYEIHLPPPGKIPNRGCRLSGVVRSFFLGEGSPTKIDYRKRHTRILTCLLEDLGAAADAHYIPPCVTRPAVSSRAPAAHAFVTHLTFRKLAGRACPLVAQSDSELTPRF